MGREGLGLGLGEGATTTVTLRYEAESKGFIPPLLQAKGRVFFAGYSVAAATAEGQHFSLTTEGQ